MKLPAGFSILIFLASCVISIDGHGRLLEPPSRASMWRTSRSDEILLPFHNCIEADYNDNQLFCGGKDTQHVKNGGKCGVCGDSFSAAVKEHEAGGKFAKGIITRQYNVGEPIEVTVEITASHKGYFEFRLCPWNNINTPVSQECLDRNLLTVENGLTRYYLTKDEPDIYKMKVYPPPDVVCSQCFFQWRYRTGNSWGCEEGDCGLGLGPQEEFYGCADIAIGTAQRQPTTCGVVPPSSPPLTSTRSTASSTTKRSTTTSSSSSISPESEAMCNEATMDGKIHCLDCHQFFQCVDNQPVTFQCGSATVCNNKKHVCDHPYNVPECQDVIQDV